MTQRDDAGADATSRRPRAREVHARMGAALAVLAFTLAACAGTPAETPAPGDASPIAGLPTGPPPDTEDGAGFTAATLDGGEIESSALGTPLVLWFWAPWCTICQAEGPGLAEVAAEFEGQVEFVGVAGLGSVEEMQTFVEDTGTDDLMHMIDADGSIWQRFGVVATPTHVFVDGEGHVEFQRSFMRTVDLRERVEELVG